MVYYLMLEATHLSPQVFGEPPASSALCPSADRIGVEGGPMIVLEERLAKQVERAETAIRTIANLGLCDAVKCFGMQGQTQSPPNFYER